MSSIPDCSSAAPTTDCATVSCRQRCALEVIDELLRLPRHAVSGEEVDLLLDFRSQVRRRDEAETTLRMFCDLRIRLENRHYLAFFRLRRWLENHLVANVRICRAADERTIPVKLDHYCVEAVRRVCLCASLGYGSIMLAPKLRFAFRPVMAPPRTVSLPVETLAAVLR